MTQQQLSASASGSGSFPSPLDEEEQEQVVQELLANCRRTATIWYRVLGVSCALVSVAYLHQAYVHVRHPYTTKTTAAVYRVGTSEEWYLYTSFVTILLVISAGILAWYARICFTFPRRPKRGRPSSSSTSSSGSGATTVSWRRKGASRGGDTVVRASLGEATPLAAAAPPTAATTAATAAATAAAAAAAATNQSPVLLRPVPVTLVVLPLSGLWSVLLGFVASSSLVHKLHALWLPASPLLAAASVWYVQGETIAMEKSVLELRTAMYRFKKL